MDTPTIAGRIVRIAGGKLRLRDPEGVLCLDVALEAAGFDDGDEVAVTVTRRQQPLPPLNLPPQHGYPYGSPIPPGLATAARVPDTLRAAAARLEECEPEPVG